VKRKHQAVWDKTEGRCWYCGQWLIVPVTDRQRLSIWSWFVPDHVTPKCQGGTNDIDNLVPACWSCNSAKNGKTLEQYRLWRELRAAGVPIFNQTQLDYLASVGFVFPEREPVIFWAEQYLPSVEE
jgi:hypothetical protein